MSKKIKKTLILSSGILVVAVIAFASYEFANNPVQVINNTNESSANNPHDPTLTTDAANKKTAIIEKNEPNPAPTNTNERQNITPVIVYAGVFGTNLEISAYAPVVETGGNCIVTVTNIASGNFTTKQSSATPGASTTGCGLLVIPVSQLGSGNHNVTVSYASDKSEGTSSATEVAIP